MTTIDDNVHVLGILTSVFGFTVVVHGSTASTSRPTDAGFVVWFGSVEPTNAENYDIWIVTA